MLIDVLKIQKSGLFKEAICALYGTKHEFWNLIMFGYVFFKAFFENVS